MFIFWYGYLPILDVDFTWLDILDIVNEIPLNPQEGEYLIYEAM